MITIKIILILMLYVTAWKLLNKSLTTTSVWFMDYLEEENILIGIGCIVGFSVIFIMSLVFSFTILSHDVFIGLLLLGIILELLHSFIESYRKIKIQHGEPIPDWFDITNGLEDSSMENLYWWIIVIVYFIVIMIMGHKYTFMKYILVAMLIPIGGYIGYVFNKIFNKNSYKIDKDTIDDKNYINEYEDSIKKIDKYSKIRIHTFLILHASLILVTVLWNLFI